VRRVLVLAVAVFLASGATAAGAAWTPGSSATGTSAGTTLDLPTSAAASATSSTAIHITWAAPSSGPAPAQYVVRRTAPTTAMVCTVSAATVACDDTGLSPSTSYSYTVEARLGTNWTSAQTSAVSATTFSPATLNLTVSGAKTAGTAFNATLKATTNGTTTDTSYSGTKTITFSGPSDAPSGAAPTYPASVLFINGIGTASITLTAAEAATLDATDGTLSGSTSVTVVAGTAAQLQFSSSSPSCASGSVTVGNKGTYTTNVTAYDAYLNPKSGTNRTVNLAVAPANGSWDTASLTITSASAETTGSAIYTRAPGNSDVTVTASATGLTSGACVVQR
jgi:hypothetical protein